MVEAQLIVVYRQKAAELRAFAKKFLNNISVEYELLRTADSYDELAEAAERRAIRTAAAEIDRGERTFAPSTLVEQKPREGKTPKKAGRGRSRSRGEHPAVVQ